MKDFLGEDPVLVVGGGMAGLTTAWELTKRGVLVKVIEPTPHRGGRIHTVTENGGRIETGMQFYYGAYKSAKRLLAEFGLLNDLVPIHLEGTMYWQGQMGRFSKTKPWLKLLSVWDNFRLQARIARKVAPILRMSPFDYRAGDRLDQIDCAEYFTRHGDDAILELAVRPMTTSYAFCEPEGHSLAMLLRILKLGGLSKIYGLKNGNDSLPQAMAKRLDVIQARVTDVLIEDGQVEGVRIAHPDGGEENLRARHVVSAVGGPAGASLFRDSASELYQAMNGLSYSTIVLCNLHLDKRLEGPDWTWIHSRKAGHKAAFAIDLLRRSPVMFPEGRSVIQVDFATPVSDRLLAESDQTIADIAIKDMEVFLPGVTEWVTHTSVVRRARTHPNFSCGMFDKVRKLQQQADEIEGLHLAGDYLRSPLCEGAVRSALQCVASMEREANDRSPRQLAA